MDDVIEDAQRLFAEPRVKQAWTDWEVKAGDMLQLSATLCLNVYGRYDPEDPNGLFSSFSRINKDHSYTPVCLRHGTPLTMFCACHSIACRFGWFEIKHITHPRPSSYSAIRFVDGETVPLDILRETHSCVRTKVW